MQCKDVWTFRTSGSDFSIGDASGFGLVYGKLSEASNASGHPSIVMFSYVPFDEASKPTSIKYALLDVGTCSLSLTESRGSAYTFKMQGIAEFFEGLPAPPPAQR